MTKELEKLLDKDEVFYFSAFMENKVIYKRVPGKGFFVRKKGEELRVFPYTDLLMETMYEFDESMLSTKEEYENQI